jgi:hypothetical protein
LLVVSLAWLVISLCRLVISLFRLVISKFRLVMAGLVISLRQLGRAGLGWLSQEMVTEIEAKNL